MRSVMKESKPPTFSVCGCGAACCPVPRTYANFYPIFMANSLNRVQVIGNLTRDPEVRQTPGGQNVATVGVATNRKWKDARGQLQEEVEYHNFVLWGRLAEIAGQYLKKGKKVYFDGRMKTRTWEDSDGKKNYKTEIIVENLIMLDGGGGNGGGGGQQRNRNAASEYEDSGEEVLPNF